MNKKIFSIVASVFILCLVSATSFWLAHPKTAGAINNGDNASACTITTSTSTPVGNQLTTVLLYPNARRAYARISLPSGASSTLSLIMNGNFAVATTTTALNASVLIGAATANGATSTPSFDFGLNALLPYTGSVTGITSVGSTTAIVTECTYQL